MSCRFQNAPWIFDLVALDIFNVFYPKRANPPIPLFTQRHC